ncbi:cation/H(+) antiporter 15-like [Phoenix dactylifera]|uniref:Cation/H(+) antiporter 15-like n=1 Tax=Phoenix dactylifera TaxID=42345 RepID=A0A8B8J615_PHODC|nr:cation/H(+) antiporter 15-like [Phoenix dactylifera]
MLLGPSFLGSFFTEAFDLMPDQNYVLMDTAANFALTYYMFMVAVELDVRAIRGMGRKVLIITVVGMVLALVVSFTSAHGLGLRPDIVIKIPGFSDPPAKLRNDKKVLPFLLFFSLAISVTGLPVLARIITEIKLLNSPLGPLSMGSAILNDLVAWILLAVTLAATGGKDGKPVSPLVPLWVTLVGAAFVLACFHVVRPAIARMARRTPEGERMSDFQLGIILAGVPAAGFLSDLIGIHSIFGSFIYGLAVPNGPLTEHLIERMEPFLSNMLLPLFFANSGFRTNIYTILPLWAITSFALVVVLATLAKVVGTILVAMAYSMSFRDSLALGFLMSVKGPVEMIILNVAIDKKVLRGDMFAVILVTSIITTALVTPVVTMAYIKPSKPLAVYRRRNIQGARPDMELRMLACVHNTRHVHSLTRLLDVSNPSKRSPIFVCALHLVDLAGGRVSSMLVMHPSARNPHYGRLHRPALPSDQAQSESILTAIDGYEQHSTGVSFQPLTAFSPPATMHEDVCSVAEERHASFIVLPFHKHMTVDGDMEEVGSSAVRPVNLNVLANAPCSVAMLVDRGLGTGAAALFPGAHRASHHVAVVFIGGPDDREALAYAWRMAEHPAIVLTVIRFIEAAPPSRLQSMSSVTDEESTSALLADAELEKGRDEEALDGFRLRFMSDESVVFAEKVARNSEETVAALRAMGGSYDLYLVGRGHRRKSALTAGLEEWSEFPELGPIGDLLVSSDFGVKVSVLVVQQYVENTGPLSQPEARQ